ncbi:MAG: hypothetical protein KBG28_22835 [Kofleriaceae bacterium]|nr:hypothetical protein [Kofleriaceae bacterium]
MRALLSALAVATAALGIAVAIPSAGSSDRGGASTLAAAPDPAPADRSAAARALTTLDARLLAARTHAARHGRDWGHLEEVARLELARAKATHQLVDYQQVTRTLTAAFALAGEGSGPLLVRAQLHLDLHRLDAASADLDRLEAAVLSRPGERAQAAALRADVAFHRGEYTPALAGFRAGHAADPHPGSAFRLALYAWKTGALDEAVGWIDQAQRLVGADDDRTWAWLEVQRGQLAAERGQYDAALAAFRAADARFDGWWYVDAQLAGALARTGALEEAITRYQRVVERTGDAEAMDALAGLLAAIDPARAAALGARASETYATWMAALPEASVGHAFLHELVAGDPARALELARRNLALRPGGEAQLWHAQALLRAGQCAAARTQIDATLATPFRSAAVHATAALAHGGCGDPAVAAAQRAAALAINADALTDLGHLAAPGSPAP